MNPPSQAGSSSRTGWWISVLGFFLYSVSDAYLLYALGDYSKTNLSDLSLFLSALIPFLVYALAFPLFLTLGRKTWTVRATVFACVAGAAVQVVIVIAVVIPGYQ